MSRSDAAERPLRIAFRTLGCRLNQYDTETMKTRLAGGRAVEVVTWRSEADVFILNSCTVTSKADQECRRLARRIKREHPRSKVVVTGCYAQTQPERLLDVPEVDGIIGNPDKSAIGEWLPELLRSEQPLVRVSEFVPREDFPAGQIDEFEGRSRAFVKVQDGCDLRCAYCLIWQARGPARSRPVEDVVRQLDRLCERGYREVVLAGVHLGAYGRDLGRRHGLTGLLRQLLESRPEIRLRLSSMHPNEIGSELLDLFATFPHLRPHLHLSLQSGSDSVLARMRRPYRSEASRKAVQSAAATVPHFGIGADIIVGFPGETDSEFGETYAFIEELPFSYLHVFRYSSRPGTAAAAMPDQVHPETVTERSRKLRELAERKREAFGRGLLGLWREAVVEAEADQEGWQRTTTDNYATILVPAGGEPGSLIELLPDGQHDAILTAARTRLPDRAGDAGAKGG